MFLIRKAIQNGSELRSEKGDEKRALNAAQGGVPLVLDFEAFKNDHVKIKGGKG